MWHVTLLDLTTCCQTLRNVVTVNVLLWIIRIRCGTLRHVTGRGFAKMLRYDAVRDVILYRVKLCPSTSFQMIGSKHLCTFTNRVVKTTVETTGQYL